MGGALDEKSLKYVDRITNETRRMGQLIDDLLAFSRIGRSELGTNAVDMNVLAGEVRDSLTLEAQGREIVWTIAEHAEIRADRNLLRQALFNLVHNAVKYTRPRARAEITIGCLVDGKRREEQTFFVRDNGVGFEMKHANRLFAVFQRLHHSKQFEGTGVGLANVQRIIHRHGGRVWAESELGSGSTFYFYPSRVRRETSRMANGMTVAVPKRILLAEDDPEGVELTLAALAEAGWRMKSRP